jgi:hypothetical protein
MVKSLYRSFAGGEITPEMFGRIDLTKFQTGLRQALNFITLPHGPAARRPGLKFVQQARSSATPGNETVRLIPFVYSATQAVIVELGINYARFHTSAGTLTEAPKIVTALTIDTTAQATIAGHGFANADWVYFTSSDTTYPLHGRFVRVGGVTANTFNLLNIQDMTGVTGVSSVGFPALPALLQAARVYTISSPYAASDLDSLTYAQNSDVLTLATTRQPTYELRRLGATNWTFTAVSFAPTLAAPAGPACVATKPTPTNVTAQHYKVTAVAADLVTESLASADCTDTNNLTLAGNFNTVSWSSVAGAARYYVYKQRGGAYGYIGQTATLSLVDDNILADTLTSPPENIITLNTGSGDYPAAVSYHEQRRWFAGAALEPQTVWATRNGTESNLTSSIPSRDDDALEFRIAARQQNAILHLVPLSDLIALTVGAEFRIFSDGGPAISPTTLSVKPQAFNGAGMAQPALATNSALYVQAQGSHIRELAYDPSGTGFFRSTDVSLMAPHLFDGQTVTQLAFTRAPEAILWAVRGDGVLLGMSYVPDQQVYGWHQHTSAEGLFESIAVIPEDGGDVLYALVRRDVNGHTLRHIERLTSRDFGDQVDAFFVDSGLSYSGAPVTTIRGLWHLEGEAVQVLADGAVVPGRSVVDGALTPALDQAASDVHVGLGYASDLMTLPLAFEGAPAAGQGTVKNVSKVYLRVADSSVVRAGPTFTKLREYPARLVTDPYGSPPSLQTGELAMSIDQVWNTDGSVCVRQDLPLPLTLVAMALETQVGG